MFDVLSKPAECRELLRIRHFDGVGSVSKKTPLDNFLLARKAVWLLEWKICPVAYKWQIDRDCRIDCVSLKARTGLAFSWKVIAACSWSFECSFMYVHYGCS